MIDVPAQGFAGAQMARQAGRDSPRSARVPGIDVEARGKDGPAAAWHRQAQAVRDVDEQCISAAWWGRGGAQNRYP